MQIPRIGMQQICLNASNHAALITPTEVGHSERVRDREAYTTSILQSNPASVWPEGSITSHSHPMLVNVEDHIGQIKDLQEALTLAIVNIVGRWWDPETDFPGRMPLEPYEEDLLKVNYISNVFFIDPHLLIDFAVDGKLANGNSSPVRSVPRILAA